MVNRNLIKSLNVSDEEVDKQICDVLGTKTDAEVLSSIVSEKNTYQPGTILTGRVVDVIGDGVIIEVGLKSEGTVPIHEFTDPGAIEPGQEVEVLLEAVESDSGLVELSKRKADRIRGWERILTTSKEGDVVAGVVMRKIKGGLLVDIGVPAFLPASQVDIRRPADIGEYIGQRIEAKILKINEERRNIVVSRRKLIEEQRAEAKEKLFEEIKEGERRTGVVKNIAEFGAFVDLGGVDGLLHITDMSWGRISHPSEIVKIDEEIECVILSVNREKEKIALGLKQKTTSPWDEVEQKYPVSTHVNGKVVNIMPYGAFVKIEEGLEGLVHVSEMSWTRRINHPSEMVSVGDEIEVVVLDINKDKQEISLGMKQAEPNPWAVVKDKYPPGTVVEGIVRNMTNFGAFIEIEEGIDGLLHVSDLSWTQKIGHPSEVLTKGHKTKCVVLTVDEQKMRVSLGLKQLTEDPWLRIIPDNYLPGQIVKGKVTKITNFGVFVELEEELEGLLHVSELADHKVDNPKDIVKPGEELEVKILRVDTDERKIGLSLKRARWAAEEGEGESVQPPKRRGGLEGADGALVELGEKIAKSDQQPAPPPPAPPVGETKAEEVAEEKPQDKGEEKPDEKAEDKPEDSPEEKPDEKPETPTPDASAPDPAVTGDESADEPAEEPPAEGPQHPDEPPAPSDDKPQAETKDD